MPSENSFPDRIGRFVLLKDACETMGPVFAPPDTDITIAAQITLITTLNTCCTNVSNAAVDLKDLSDPRAASIKDIKERVGRAVSRLKSNRAWASKLPSVKMAADKVRGVSPPKSTTPPAPSDPDAPAPKTRDRGGRSYRDIEGHLAKFISALAKCPGYDTGAPADIFSGAFTTLLGTLKTANDAIPDKEVALHNAQIDRLQLFESKKPLPDGSASLRDRWARIKQSVAAQYGRSSAEYALVKGIKY